MKKITVTIQGAQVQAAFLNPRVARAYEDGKKRVVERCNAATQFDDQVSAISEMCQATIDFVTDLFGEDGAREIFGEETDLETCMDVFNDLMNVYQDQVNPIVSKKVAAIKGTRE